MERIQPIESQVENPVEVYEQRVNEVTRETAEHVFTGNREGRINSANLVTLFQRSTLEGIKAGLFAEGETQSVYDTGEHRNISQLSIAVNRSIDDYFDSLGVDENVDWGGFVARDEAEAENFFQSELTKFNSFLKDNLKEDNNG